MRRAASGAVLIDATASPSPDSVRRHLELLDHYAELGIPTAAVLGDLASAETVYRSVGAILRRLPVGRLLTVGVPARWIGQEAHAQPWVHHATVADATRALLHCPFHGRALVLVQSAPGSGLHRLVAALEAGHPVTPRE